MSSRCCSPRSIECLDGNDVVFIARASPTRIFSAGIDIGYRLPAFCTSVGRVLLSRLPDDELAKALTTMDLAPLTPSPEPPPVTSMRFPASKPFSNIV